MKNNLSQWLLRILMVLVVGLIAFLSIKRVCMSKKPYPPKVAMLENLKKTLQKLPPFSMEACDQFEKDLRIFDSVKNNDYLSFGRVDYHSDTQTFWLKCVPHVFGDFVRRMNSLFDYLNHLQFKCPYNFSFFITIGDLAYLSEDISKKIYDIPFLCMDRTLNGSGLEKAIIVPDYHVIDCHYETTIQNITKNIKKKKFFPRLDVAGWRGAQSNSYLNNNGKKFLFDLSAIGIFPRLDLVLFSVAHPDYVDAKFNDYTLRIESGEEGEKYIDFMYKTCGPPAPFVPFEEMVKYKYNVSLDGGVSAWGRTPWVLFTKSVLLYHSIFETFYTPYFKPYVHYIPIKPDMSDMKEKIDELRANPELYKKIVKNGSQFAEEIFTPEAIKEYWVAVLKGISAKFA